MKPKIPVLIDRNEVTDLRKLEGEIMIKTGERVSHSAMIRILIDSYSGVGKKQK